MNWPLITFLLCALYFLRWLDARRRFAELVRVHHANLRIVEQLSLEIITLQAKFNRLLGEKCQVESQRDEYRSGFFLASKMARIQLAAANEKAMEELAELRARLKKAHR